MPMAKYNNFVILSRVVGLKLSANDLNCEDEGKISHIIVFVPGHEVFCNMNWENV